LTGDADLVEIITVLGKFGIQADEIRREKASLEEIYTRAMQEAGTNEPVAGHDT
jgi:hypothetical protein